MGRLGPGKISSDDTTVPATLPDTPLDSADVVQAGTGIINAWNYGMGAGNTAAANTTALNAAIVASGGTTPIYIPPGIYDLNALTKTEPFQMYGAGRGTVLRFNTTGTGIECEDLTPDQGQTFYLHDLSFANVTNTPASYILNRYPVNSRFERLYFSSCAATYCIDNESGYGTTIRDCVFSDVTGSGVRLRQNSAKTDYSYVARIDGCDFTRLSGDAIDVEGANVLRISHTVIESCGGRGIYTNSNGGSSSNVSENIIIDSCYFETNTGVDIECASDGTYFGHLTLLGCYFIGTPSIALNTSSSIAIIGCYGQGGDECAITGGTSASVRLLNSSGFSHAAYTGAWIGSLGWYEGSGSPENVVYAPIGSLYSDTDGGANVTLYIKESGAGTNTGWVAK